MTVLRGDCVAVMDAMEADSVDAICTDPPYGLEFMGKEWDSLSNPQGNRLGLGRPKTFSKGMKLTGAGNPSNRIASPSYSYSRGLWCVACKKPQGGKSSDFSVCRCEVPEWRDRHRGAEMGEWHQQWATAALRVAKPGAYLLAFGGTRTVHRMTCALEDAGWVIRDMLVWAYAQGFPKSRASLKPAWEPIVLARKPGASRDLNIDAARLPVAEADAKAMERANTPGSGRFGDVNRGTIYGGGNGTQPPNFALDTRQGRWPANVILTDPILDGGWEGVVGGGETKTGKATGYDWSASGQDNAAHVIKNIKSGVHHGDTGTYSRFFLIPKAPTRERVLSDGRRSPHPTQKPEALIRHLVTLVTPTGGTVLDPFLGSGTLGVVCDGLGVQWVGIEREAEYADWAEERIRDKAPEWAA